jgi:hypothetical protein
MHTGIEHCSMTMTMTMTLIFTAILIEHHMSSIFGVNDSSITIYGGDKDQNEYIIIIV